MMNEEKVQILFVYLDKLRNLQECGINKYHEIEQVVQAINNELGLEQKYASGSQLRKIDISHHIDHHPLIALDEKKEPVVKGTDITVRSLLNDLAIGRTVHQLCGDYDLDINQVSGAVTFAAYVVSDGVY